MKDFYLLIYFSVEAFFHKTLYLVLEEVKTNGSQNKVIRHFVPQKKVKIIIYVFSSSKENVFLFFGLTPNYF